jgi:hypothetical protein
MAKTKARKPEKQEVGRLALRHEGTWWNAYWAKHQDSMNDAVLLGSIRMSLAHGAAKDAFVGTMTLAFDQIVHEVVGQTPEWSEPHAAPEHEKAGNA